MGPSHESDAATMRHTFVVAADAGLANAIRRTLLADLHAWAPHKLTITANTSHQTDEYIAHRIGLIPFRRIGNGDTLVIRKTGGMVYGRDVVGSSFEPVHPDIPIMDLGSDASLDIVIHFDRNKPRRHTRYSTCVALGMQKVSENSHKITFELHDPQVSAKDVVLRALDAFEERIDDCLLQLAKQPTTPPKSRCG